MDIEFTVNVVPGVSTSGPRAENEEYLMSMGIAGSLEAALKLATTQLAQWIESEYKLTPNETAIVLGTSIHLRHRRGSRSSGERRSESEEGCACADCKVG